MAIGTKSDFKIYHAEFHSGVFEGVAQALEAFNGVSNGAIRMVSNRLRGDYDKESFFKLLTSAINRRDITSTSDVTSGKLEQGEIIGVKVNRRFGPIENTIDSLRKVSKDDAEFSFVLGQQFGALKAQDMLNTGILAVEAAIEGQSTNLNYDATGLSVKTLVTANLHNAMALMGDAFAQLRTWVMHSKPYFDLVGAQVADKMETVAGVVIYGASPATFGRPVIVTDAPALWDANGSATDTYNVLGLVEDAVVVTESEEQEMEAQKVLGKQNITIMMQGEYAFNVKCKGLKWNTSAGGVNPTDAALATTTNWVKEATSYKHLSGVRIKVQ
jgi:hypothetical protein